MLDFSLDHGKRSSQSAGKRIFGAAAAAVDQDLARRIESLSEWRKTYIAPVRDLVAAGVRSPKDALHIAEAGLSALRENVVIRHEDGDRPLADILGRGDPPPTSIVTGQGERNLRLEIPYRGAKLSGDALKRQLDSWLDAGILEPSAVAAVTRVVDDPSWLDLSDSNFALLGAASEMGPLEPLCAWGAHVLAVDLPREDLWDRIIATARSGTGRVSFPTRHEIPGIDLLEDPSDAHAWLSSFEAPMTIGNYVYADGSNFVLLASSVDMILSDLLAGRADLSMAYLATPTDVFAVTQAVVDGARAHTGLPGRLLAAITRGRLYEKSYSDLIEAEDGRRWGIYDCLVPQQGANYALAKSVQRWRAIDAKAAGTLVSANVAPATYTRSVVKNRILAAAYGGAHRFGVEIFEPETSRFLMAALLVHDLRNPRACGAPGNQPPHPNDLFVDGAVHGGLWRLGHTPRSILPLAVLTGIGRRRS